MRLPSRSDDQSGRSHRRSEGAHMSFADTFATELGRRTGTTVDTDEFPDSDAVAADLRALQDFLGGLDDTDRSTLDIIASDGIDLSQATDDNGDAAIPGGSFLTLAGTAGEALSNLAAQAQEAFQAATETPDGSQSQVASTDGRTTSN